MTKPYRFCTAPLMDWSDRHCRYFWRLLSKQARLYSEMVTTGALLQGDRERFLQFNREEHPLALQVGGSDPDDLAAVAELAENWHYDEINLNCGCPSDRVQNGMIGACLMAHPPLVADCIRKMIEHTAIPVTIKHRIGIDDMDDWDGLLRFVETIAHAGCKVFIVHARKAWLQGLSPKENREIPPLIYENVYRLKELLPDLTIVINGGIKSIAECKQHLQYVDGVMLGRESYQNPSLLAEVDSQLFGSTEPVPSAEVVMKQYIDYCQRELAKGTALHHMSKHVLGLFQGKPGARAFRRHISENAHRPDASHHILEQALEKVL